MNFLNQVVKTKKKEIKELKAKVSLGVLKRVSLSYKSRRIRPFIPLFVDNKRMTVIAEIKPKSPSSGVLIKRSPLKTASLYSKSKAKAVSVLTDRSYFGGDISLLGQVRKYTKQSILRKDFIIDQYQVYETFLAGADAFLLIANILSVKDLSHLILLGERLGLDALVEVHTNEDVKKALKAKAKVIGINNRDLSTLEIDLGTTDNLLKLIPKEIPVISESGIKNAVDARRLKSLGVAGVLVGTSVLQSKDPIKKISELAI